MESSAPWAESVCLCKTLFANDLAVFTVYVLKHISWDDHANAVPITTCSIMVYVHMMLVRPDALTVWRFEHYKCSHSYSVCLTAFCNDSRDYLQSYNVIWALLDPAMIFQFLECGPFIRLDIKFIGNWRKSASWGMKKFIFPEILKLHTYTPDVTCNIGFTECCICHMFGVIWNDECAQE